MATYYSPVALVGKSDWELWSILRLCSGGKTDVLDCLFIRFRVGVCIWTLLSLLSRTWGTITPVVLVPLGFWTIKNYDPFCRVLVTRLF